MKFLEAFKSQNTLINCFQHVKPSKETEKKQRHARLQTKARKKDETIKEATNPPNSVKANVKADHTPAPYQPLPIPIRQKRHFFVNGDSQLEYSTYTTIATEKMIVDKQVEISCMYLAAPCVATRMFKN